MAPKTETKPEAEHTHYGALIIDNDVKAENAFVQIVGEIKGRTLVEIARQIYLKVTGFEKIPDEKILLLSNDTVCVASMLNKSPKEVRVGVDWNEVCSTYIADVMTTRFEEWIA